MGSGEIKRVTIRGKVNNKDIEIVIENIIEKVNKHYLTQDEDDLVF